MVVVYHNRGTGSGSGPVEYLLGKDRDRENAELKRGNPDQTIELIDSLDFSKKYTSGLLSFTEINLPEETKNQIMDDFEKATFCGLDHDQYDILWVEHRDKKNLELNFVIPNVELQTGKRFQPYYDKIDRIRINQYRDIQNMKYELSQSIDPNRRQLHSASKNLPKDKKEISSHLEKNFLEGIKSGAIEDRNDIIQTLETAGFKIARTTPKSISIEDPDGGRNIRLKGEIYEQTFRNDGQYRESNKREIEAFRATSRSNLQSTIEKHREYVGKKSEFHRGKYKRAYEENVKDNSKELDGLDIIRSHNISDSFGDRISTGKENIITSAADKESGKSIADSGQLGNLDSGGGRREISDISQGNNTGDRLSSGRQGIREAEGEGIDNDRNRKTLIDSIRGFGERARETTRRIQEYVSNFGRRIQDNPDRKSRDSKRKQNFEWKIGSLDRGIGNREEEIRRSRNRGHGY